MTTYTPRHEESGVDFTVSSDFTGSNGDSNRTYALGWPDAVIAGMDIVVAGASLQNTSDYTFDSGTNTITFLNAIYDNQKITIDYNTEFGGLVGSDTAYATTEQLAKFMQIYEQSIDAPNNTFIEEVGTGDNSDSTFFLDHKGVIANSYTLYYGATAEASLSNTLTETTHYTLDKDKGLITLNSAGITALSTNNLYADYAYNKLGIPESELQNALNRAAENIDSATGTHFADGTETTPDWVVVSNEEQRGKGRTHRDYFSQQFPIADISTTLTADIAVDDTTISVTSTNGFPSSGTLAIGSEKITYSAKSSNTFTITAATSTHNSGDTVTSHVIEMSTTESGTAPTWTVLQKDIDYDLDTESGRVRIYRDDILLDVTNESYPPQYPNRFRMSYLMGWDEISYDITQLTLMLASKDLTHAAVRYAMVNGMDNFQPNIINVDEDWIKKKFEEYKSMQTSNI